ncbi:hypothetical protein DOY81_009656 [Sarcophaga bullata]|nr:hypothetical protein DOY81_009656 [Sarcophaga bullata]
MKIIIFSICVMATLMPAVRFAAIEGEETNVHFDFKTENGQQRVEDIKYVNQPKQKESTTSENLEEVTMEPVEYRGGYSFISADGYEYTVKYKANKNGFQPYVTAHKLKSPPNIGSS